jgi:dTDP-4-dehydrorhamnose 3,5-epimerase
MKFTETTLKGAFVVDLEKREDDRGFFARAWCQHEFESHGIYRLPVQSNMSYNIKAGTMRGMHYQAAPYQESKLIRCINGSVYDVIIDLRKDSPTYKQWFGIELNSENRTMLFVPEDFAHGFLALKDDSEVMYQVSAFYTPGSEMIIRFNDPSFNIQWPMKVVVISEKDKNASDFK